MRGSGTLKGLPRHWRDALAHARRSSRSPSRCRPPGCAQERERGEGTGEESAQMTAATRNEVLGLYRRIFRIARTWQSLTGLTDDSSKEKQYIVMEAKALFKKNKNLTDAEAIKNCITECHTRIEMGLHYRIPYPRPANHPQIELHDYTGSYAFTYQGSNFYNSHSKSLYFSCRYIYLLWDLLIKKDASLKCKRG